MNEAAWKNIFNNEIQESGIEDRWDLCVDKGLSRHDSGLRYTPHIFGSFRCSHCHYSWNSSKVFVLFLINKSWRNGTVRMNIFRQECRKCSYPVMVDPEISTENMKRVICNLKRRILRQYYGMYVWHADLDSLIYGKLDGPHERKHCEACRHGFCDAGEQSAKWGIQLQSNISQEDDAISCSALICLALLLVAVVVVVFALGAGIN